MLGNNLRILQANLNKSQSATESTLQMAIELSVDIIAVQEPWLTSFTKDPLDYSEARSTLHSSFIQSLPTLPSNSSRPRVLFYFSRSFQAQINPNRTFSLPDPDFLAVDIQYQRASFTLLNVYNEDDQLDTGRKTIERVLLANTLPPSSLLLGDFNIHHPWWEPACPRVSTEAERFVNWIEDQGITLLNTPGCGTFFRSNMQRETVLDLSFCTSDLEPKVHDWQILPSAGSDHHGILFSLQFQRRDEVESPIQQPRFNCKKADWDLFNHEFAIAIKKSPILSTLDLIPPPSRDACKRLLNGEDPTLADQLDQIGQALTDAIIYAASKAIPTIKLGPRPKPWWNEDLIALRNVMGQKKRYLQRELRRCPADSCFLWKQDWLQARNAYFRAIKTAKKNHWTAFLEKEDPASVFKAMEYTKNSRVERIPQIRSPTSATLQTSFEGKCSAFRTALFPPPPVTSPPSWSNYTETNWDWPILSEIEVEMACSSEVRSSTPGPDAITQGIITAAHRAQPKLLFQVFSILFNYGHHPICWKEATGAILKKNGKPDYSVPKAYRVIALENCLGKVNERAQAKRLGALAEVTHLLHPSQIGGRRSKSAVDAAILLVDTVQVQKQLGRITTTLFLDIKGAFDHVSQNQLLGVLQRLGLPISLIAWINSFLSDRQLRLSFDGQTEQFTTIRAGIPQGSPISPILFLIYIRELLESTATFNLSYMDDLALSVSSTSLRKNVQTLEREVARLFDRASSSAIVFDSAKTELIHFTASKKASEATLALPDGSIVKPKTTVKWLGIYFDNRLSFKEHVSTQTAKARSALFRLCRLANTESGLSPFAMRQLYSACITSIADYGCQVYWKNQAFVKQQLQSLQNLALRKILGTFRTTPIVPMEVEAALPPPHIRLNSALRRYAFRVSMLLARNHPVRQAAERALATRREEESSDQDSDDDTQPAKSTPHRQLLTIVDSIAATLTRHHERVVCFRFYPWEMATPYRIEISSKGKEEAATAHNTHMRAKMGSSLLAIYGDASSIPGGTGIGVGIIAHDYRNQGQEVYQETVNIGKGQIVYNGELEAIARGFEYAATVASEYEDIHIHADNQAAIHRIKTPSDRPGQIWQLRCLQAAERVREAGASIVLHWVPGHTDVPGNEKADLLAKEAAKLSPSSDVTSLALIGIKIKNLALQEWREYLQQYTRGAVQKNPNTYAARFAWKIRKRLSIPSGTRRETACAFYRLKTGHGYTKSYLHRTGKSESDKCSCGAVQSPQHLLLSCRRYSRERSRLKEELGTGRLSLPLLLHTSKGITATLSFLSHTGIGTRKWHLGQMEEEQELENGG